MLNHFKQKFTALSRHFKKWITFIDKQYYKNIYKLPAFIERVTLIPSMLGPWPIQSSH